MKVIQKQINSLLFFDYYSSNRYLFSLFITRKITSFSLQNPIKNIICSPE